MDRISWIRSKAEGKVLDVGCAGGENFKGSRFEVIYTDINEFPLPNFICADAHHLPFNDNSFDSVVIGELLEHVTNPVQVLKQATRVSRKKVIFTVPNEFAWPVQLKPLMPLEARLKETGLTKEEQFKRDNPTCTKINDLSQAWHRRYYDRGMLQSQLNLIGLPYEVEELNYGGWSFWVGEIRKAPVIERAIRIKEVASSMEWTDYQFLTEPTAFLITKQLYQIEQAIGRDVADSLHTTRRFEYPWVYINLQPFTKDDIVLDAGAGPTTLQFYLSRMVKEVHNIDIYPDWIEWVSKVKKEKSFPNLFPVLGDLTEMTFPSNHFDKAICISVLEHLPKDKVIAGIEELIRVTKPGGKIAITMDVVLEKTDKQTDLEDFGKIAEKYSFKIPDLPPHGMILRVPPYNLPFAVPCILLEKI